MGALSAQMESDAEPDAPVANKPSSLSDLMAQDVASDAKEAKEKPVLRVSPTKESALSAPDFKDVKMPEPDNTTAPEVAAHVISGVGATIGGGLHGGWNTLKTLATGGSIDDAMKAGADTVEADQKQFTYQPRTEGGKEAVGKIGAAMGSARDFSGRAVEHAADQFAQLPPTTPLGQIGLIAKVLPGSARTAGEVGFDTAQMLPAGRLLRGEKVVPIRSGEPAPVGAPTGEMPITERVEPTLAPQSESVTLLNKWDAATQAHKAAIADKSVPIAKVQALGEEASNAGAEYTAAKQAEHAAPVTKPLLRTAPSQPLALEPETGRPRTEPAQPAQPLQAPTLAPADGASRDRFTTPAERGEEPPKFMQEEPESGPAGSVEAIQRAETLQRVGIQDARLSALEGDKTTSASQHQESKLDNPRGRFFAQQLENEKKALTDYSDNLVQDTGGTHGLDAGTLYSRGDTILRPLEDLNKYFNEKTRQLYAEADARAEGKPVGSANLSGVMKDKAEFYGKDAGKQLYEGVGMRMRDLGIMDENGNMLPMTVKQGEQLRQYLGRQWKSDTSYLISRLKNAIDDDVMSAPGMEDIYKNARGMRAAKAAVFENDLPLGNGRSAPNGIEKFMDAHGAGVKLKGANTVEKIPDIVTSMPYDQLAHVVKSLKNLPEELQPQGQAALAEIKAQFANKIREIGGKNQGQWAAKDVSQYLNKNASRMQQVFDQPGEMAKFNDLNDAGHILAKPEAYPGAEAQKHNFLRSGAVGVAKGAGAVLGSMVLAPKAGAAMGSAVIGSVIDKAGEAAALSKARSQVVNLNDILAK